jgi:ABC-type transport system involved in cytochrome bd biosynthesis fused ATPase/permease subunit
VDFIAVLPDGLDEATADAMMKAVAERLRGRTLIVISNRVQDLSIVDSVVRLGQSRIQG